MGISKKTSLATSIVRAQTRSPRGHHSSPRSAFKLSGESAADAQRGEEDEADVVIFNFCLRICMFFLLSLLLVSIFCKTEIFFIFRRSSSLDFSVILSRSS